MTSQVVGSDFTDGALLPNYVNGRLLVAEDLATGQTSLRTRDARIGEAAGAGVVRGLWVTAAGSTLTVAGGLGIARAGEPVVVARPTTLQLTFTTSGSTPDRSSFSCCGSGTPDGTGSSLTQGILLLTARAACKLDGTAPMAPSPGSEVSPCCAAQWLVAGVEFRAIALPVGTTVDGVTVTAGNRRNMVAHWVYGTERLTAIGADPFSFNLGYTGLDLLDPADLTSYDVPLAVFRWDGTTVADLDNWSARRRVTESDPVTASWSVTTADHRVSDGEARFLQFQEQAEGLVARGTARRTSAGDVFGLLPPVGFLPVDNAHLVAMADASVTRYRMLTQQEAAPVTTEDVAKAEAARWAARLPEEITLTEKAANPLLLTHLATGTPQDLTFAGTPERLKAGLSYYQDLFQLGSNSVGYGFDPRIFFGPLASFGGVLDWQLAEWALHQSWRAFPVPVPPPTIDWRHREVLTTTDVAAGHLEPTYLARLRTVSDALHVAAEHPDLVEATPAEASSPVTQPQMTRAQPPITYYYVIDNLEAARSSLQALRVQERSFVKQALRSFTSSNLYVVFIANRRWVQDTWPPFMDHRVAGPQVAGDPILGGLPDET
ncbi:hypothetical protein GCM10028801_38150 [Nocardioides maradonensis]